MDSTPTSDQAAQERDRIARLFEHAPGFMAMLGGPDHRFEIVNPGYMKLVGHRPLIGRTVAEALPEVVPQGFVDLLDVVYRTGKPHAASAAKVVLQHAPDAPLVERYLHFTYEPTRDRAGNVTGIAVQGIDVTDRVEAERRREALTRLSERFLDAESPADAEFAAGQILGETLGLVRAGYGAIDPQTETLTVRRDWTNGTHSIAGTLNLRDYGSFVDDLKRGELIRIDDIDADPRTAPAAAIIRERGVQAFVNLPVMEKGALVGMVIVNDAEKRVWTDAEVAFVRDIAARTRVASERIRTASGLRESERRYEALFNAIDEGFCIIEFFDGPHGPLSDYIHVEANAAYTHHAGIPDVVGKKVREMVPDEAQGWVELYRGVLETGTPIRFEKELEATGRWLELAAFRVEPQSRKQVAVLFKDLTARKRAEEALRELNVTLEQRVSDGLAERKLLADIIQNADAFVQVADRDLRWLAINEASVNEFERIFGVTPRIGVRMTETLAHLPDQAAAVEAIWRRAMTDAPFIEVQQLGDPGRDRRHYEMRYYPLLDHNGDRIGAFQIAYDVTERLNDQARLRETEEALRQSQKMEAIGQLTGGIAHDFNNLLAAIGGSLSMIERRIVDGKPGLERYIGAGQDAVKRAASLTQRLLAFSRRQTLDPKPLDCNKLINGMEELIRRTVGPNVEVEVVGAAGLWPTRADPSQLESSLLNLCINARDAMAPNGGRVTIETANKWLDERSARERDLSPGQYVSLCVTDTGIGMDEQTIARAFDPFFTTKPIGQGTGLGLSMVYGFVRQSGGQVRIYSELGKGTTMCLYLPRFVGAVEDITDAAPADLAAGSGETVLVIDDEPTLRMLITEVLEEAGYRILQAGTGPEGLRILQSDARIDLLVTDVGLPGGMNGRQVADAARLTRPELKILFITGYAENAAVGNGLLERGMEVVTKPFVITDFANKVRDLIDR